MPKSFTFLPTWHKISSNLEQTQKQNLSVNLHCAHFRAILLVEILEQQIRMLETSVAYYYAENVFIGLGPGHTACSVDHGFDQSQI